MRLLRNSELFIYYIRRTVYPKHSIGRVASWDHEEPVPVKILGHLRTIFCHAVVSQKPIFPSRCSAVLERLQKSQIKLYDNATSEKVVDADVSKPADALVGVRVTITTRIF